MIGDRLLLERSRFGVQGRYVMLVAVVDRCSGTKETENREQDHEYWPGTNPAIQEVATDTEHDRRKNQLERAGAVVHLLRELRSSVRHGALQARSFDQKLVRHADLNTVRYTNDMECPYTFATPTVGHYPVCARSSSRR